MNTELPTPFLFLVPHPAAFETVTFPMKSLLFPQFIDMISYTTYGFWVQFWASRLLFGEYLVHLEKAGTDPYIVFPIVGFLDGCTSTPYIRTGRSNLWSAPYSDSGGLANVLRVNTDGSTKNEGERFARGFTVRCVVVE